MYKFVDHKLRSIILELGNKTKLIFLLSFKTMLPSTTFIAKEWWKCQDDSSNKVNLYTKTPIYFSNEYIYLELQ